MPTARLEITADEPIDLGVQDGELPPSTDLPTWLLLAASGQALRLAGLIVLLHREPPTDRDLTLGLFAALLGVRKVDTVAEYVKELEAVGWLTVERRRVSGWQVANRYRFRHSPPPGHVTPHTVADLMAVVDARQNAPVDGRKTAGHAVPRSSGVRTPKKRGTATPATQNRRSRRTPENRVTDPEKTGSSKELPCCPSGDKDRSIDRGPSPADEPARPTPSERARSLVAGLDYAPHPRPAPVDVEGLALLVDQATGHGVPLADVRAHLQAAIGRCRSAVVPYLAGALELDRLPAPRTTPPAAGDLPPACPACLAEHPAARTNVRWRMRDGQPCSACHPNHTRVIPGPEMAQDALTAGGR